MKIDVTQLEEFQEVNDEEYVKSLLELQVELLALQRYLVDSRKRLIILFEGRDTAGKGGAILRFSQHLNPRYFRIVALTRPTETESSQWYFQRYVSHLPSAGQMTLFDRSWYNRAVVEPALGFCTKAQYKRFINQVIPFEEMLIEDGIVLIKFWFSIDEVEQARRLEDRKTNPLKAWKLSPTDFLAHEKFDEFSKYRKAMFEKTSSKKSPWIRVWGNEKKIARLQSIKYVLSRFDYPEKGKSAADLTWDKEIIQTV